MSPHKKPFAEIIFIYLIIGLCGFICYRFLPFENKLWRFFAADSVMTVVTFIFSLYKKNSSVYDAYWSVIPFYFIVLCWFNTHQSWGIAQYTTALVISFWSWRLTHNWYRSWRGWDHEDWRYVNFRKQFGKYFQPINFLAIHLYPTCIVFLSMSGLFFLYDGTTKNLNAFFIAGNTISLAGVLFELVADNTLYKNRNNPGRVKYSIIREGIWNHTRNPNYLGEILFWAGLAMTGLAASAPAWTCLGSIGMVLMFLFASIPMKEKRLSATYDDFEKYLAEVPMLLPIPFKKEQ